MKKTFIFISSLLFTMSHAQTSYDESQSFGINKSSLTAPLFYLSNSVADGYKSYKKEKTVDLYIDRTVLSSLVGTKLENNKGIVFDQLHGEKTLNLPLLEGGNVDLKIEKLKRYDAESFSIIAKGVNNQTAQLVLSKAENYFSGTLFIDGKVYNLSPKSEDTVTLGVDSNFSSKRDFVKYSIKTIKSAENKNNKIKNGISVTRPTSPQKHSSQADNSRPVIDLMYLYSNNLVQQVGSESAIKAKSQSSADTFNLVLSNSQVNAEVRLVHSGLVNFSSNRTITDEFESFGDTLDRLTKSSEVATLRNEKGADLVQFYMPGPADGICGLGNLPTKYTFSFSNQELSGSGFQVSRYTCGDYTSVHEFGHNLGLSHNREDTDMQPNELIFPFAYGYYVDGEFSTIMTYPSRCSNYCPRSPYFSTPSVGYKGHAVGSQNANNAGALRSTIGRIAQYRPSKNTNKLSNLTGLWFDPALRGSGFHFVTRNGETIVSYYGFTQNGERLWLVSDKNLLGKKGTTETIHLYETLQSTFSAPSNQSSEWGAMRITFFGCQSASATLIGRDGTLTYSNLIQLAPSKSITCN